MTCKVWTTAAPMLIGTGWSQTGHSSKHLPARCDRLVSLAPNLAKRPEAPGNAEQESTKETEMKTPQTYRAALIATDIIDSPPQKPQAAFSNYRVRFIKRDVAVVDSLLTVRNVNGPNETIIPVVPVNFFFVAVRHADRWLIQDGRAHFAAAPPSNMTKSSR